MIYILSALIIFLAINSLIILTPITLGLNLLTISILTAILFSLTSSSWISFLIFLIYIRGTLIIFSYFVAITPNKQITYTYHFTLILVILILTIIIVKFTNQILNSFTTSIKTNTFYKSKTIITLIIIALVLIFTIVIVVKVSSSKKGPLRPFKYE